MPGPTCCMTAAAGAARHSTGFRRQRHLPCVQHRRRHRREPSQGTADKVIAAVDYTLGARASYRASCTTNGSTGTSGDRPDRQRDSASRSSAMPASTSSTARAAPTSCAAAAARTTLRSLPPPSAPANVDKIADYSSAADTDAACPTRSSPRWRRRACRQRRRLPRQHHRACRRCRPTTSSMRAIAESCSTTPTASVCVGRHPLRHADRRPGADQCGFRGDLIPLQPSSTGLEAQAVPTCSPLGSASTGHGFLKTVWAGPPEIAFASTRRKTQQGHPLVGALGARCGLDACLRGPVGQGAGYANSRTDLQGHRKDLRLRRRPS